MCRLLRGLLVAALLGTLVAASLEAGEQNSTPVTDPAKLRELDLAAVKTMFLGWQGCFFQDPNSKETLLFWDNLMHMLARIPRERRTTQIDNIHTHALVLAGKYDEARTTANEALRRQREVGQAGNNLYLWRGRAEYGLQDFAAAERDFTSAIQLFPQDAEAFRRRGDNRSKSGKLREALADYQRAIAIIEGVQQSDKNADKNTSSKNTVVVAAAEVKRKLGRGNEADKDLLQLLKSGSSFLSDKQVMELTTRVIATELGNADAYFFRAEASLHDQPRPRIADLTKFIELETGNSSRKRDAYLMRANTLHDDNQVKQAIDDVTQALQIEESAKLLLRRARWRSEVDLYLEAAEDVNAALKLVPTADHASAEWIQNRAFRAQQLQFAGKLADARRELDELLRIDAKHPTALLVRAGVLVEMGSDALAKQDLELLREVSPQTFQRSARSVVESAVARRRAKASKIETPQDSRGYNRQAGGRAWQLGALLSLASVHNALGKTDSAEKLMTSAERVAASLQLMLNSLPKADGQRSEKLSAGLKYVAAERKRLGEEITAKFDETIRRTFGLATSIYTLDQLYGLGNQKFNGSMASSIRVEGPRSGMPESIWKELPELVETDADKEKLHAATKQASDAAIAWFKGE